MLNYKNSSIIETLMIQIKFFLLIGLFYVCISDASSQPLSSLPQNQPENQFKCNKVSSKIQKCTLLTDTKDFIEIINLPISYTPYNDPMLINLPKNWTDSKGKDRTVGRVLINLVFRDKNKEEIISFKNGEVVILRVTPPNLFAHNLVLLKYNNLNGEWIELKPLKPVVKGKSFTTRIINWGDPPIAWGD